jgi:hypothetical protein
VLSRCGRNGLEELQAHPWLADVDWENILHSPAPYLPEGCDRIKTLLRELDSITIGSHEHKRIIQEITQNFDQFTDTSDIWEGTRKSPAPSSIAISSTSTTAAANANQGMMTMTPVGKVKGSGNGLNDEFIGYTFKRKKNVVRSALSEAFYGWDDKPYQSKASPLKQQSTINKQT